MISELVVNGCSYMWNYAAGNGHVDLAHRLNLKSSESIARCGSSNNRIIRTTLKHSYNTLTPTLYIVGLTFVDREEQPISKNDDQFEGRWLSIQNGFLDNTSDEHWTQSDFDLYLKVKTKIALTNNIVDRLEDLMYRVLSMISDLKSRGHKILVFQQVPDRHEMFKTNHKLSTILQNNCIIDSLGWYAVPWQVDQGVRTQDDAGIPKHIQHIEPGEHRYLNDFLEEYVRLHGIHL